MAIRLLLGRQIGAVSFRAMVYGDPLARFALATFTRRHGTLKARVILFCAAGFLDSEGPADSKIEE
jgi:hypothetical protein